MRLCVRACVCVCYVMYACPFCLQPNPNHSVTAWLLARQVRQWLYTFQDCLHGGLPKARAAATHLQEIFPSVVATGVDVNIPMPGHVAAAMTPATGGADPSAELQRSWSQLDNLIATHDAVFLLTDSRESRWLPTLLAQAHRKLTINVALGFDSYLVMRHGVHSSHAMVDSLIVTFFFLLRLSGRSFVESC